MASTSDFYLAQAEQNAQAAAATDLPNVRERCLRAEAAWRDMASRAERVLENKQAALAKAAVASAL
jgi:hypothetical protein